MYELEEANVVSQKVSLKLDKESREFMALLMMETPPEEQRFLRLLIKDQLSTLRNSSGRCVWHLEVLDWCTDVYRRSPHSYSHMALAGFLKLPHPDTCRKRAGQVQMASGESPAMFDALRKRLEGLPPARREMALLYDEINIVGDVAFKVVSGEYRFFGFIDEESASFSANLYGGPTCMAAQPVWRPNLILAVVSSLPYL